jgi:hypothetical protein
VFINTELKFGASTRTYIVRERPQLSKNASGVGETAASSDLNTSKDDSFTQLVANLPESETELDVKSFFFVVVVVHPI